MKVPTGHTKQMKEMVRKRTASAVPKAIQTGKLGNIFTAYIFWNPTYRELQGGVHVPEGMTLPDLNKFLLDYLKTGERRRPRRRNPRRQPQGEAADVLEEIVVEPSQSCESNPEEDDTCRQSSKAAQSKPGPSSPDVRSQTHATNTGNSNGLAPVAREQPRERVARSHMSMEDHLQASDDQVMNDGLDGDADAIHVWDMMAAPAYETETGGNSNLFARQSVSSNVSSSRLDKKIKIEQAVELMAQFRRILRS